MRKITFYNSHHVNPYSKHFCYYSIAVVHKYPVKHSQQYFTYRVLRYVMTANVKHIKLNFDTRETNLTF